jgi:serine/threonine protein kinase
VKWLSNNIVEHLRAVADWPDLSGTTYEILDKLGRGGMASVYLAKDRKLDRQVALKVLDIPEDAAESKSRLLEEARIIARLEHPGIVPIHDLGVLADGRFYYVMKLVRGSRLDEETVAAKDVPASLRVFEKVCQAVAFAHAHGVIHRDLKPQNIMVGPFGEVLVLDWGVAKLVQATEARVSGQPKQNGPVSDHQTADGTVIGTPGYMAPEQARGEIEAIDKRTDVYALGGILYFLLTRRHPVSEEMVISPPRKLDSSIPKALEAICLKALSAAPAERYQGVSDLSGDVGRYLSQLPISAYREGIFDTANRLFSKYRTAILLVLAYLVVRIVLLFWTGT